MLYRSICLSLLLISSLALSAQQHQLKAGVLGLLFRTINLEYEHQTKPHQSVALQAGGMLPWSNPGGVVQGRGPLVTVLNVAGPTFDLQRMRLTGANATGQYRVYVYQRGDLTGGYIAPYLTVNTLRVRFDFETTLSDPLVAQTEQVAVRGRVNWLGVGGGVQLGWQWRICENLVIDWYAWGLTLRASYFQSQFVPQNEPEILTRQHLSREIGQILSGIRGYGHRLTQNRLMSSTQVLRQDRSTPIAFRTGLSVGYAF